MTVAFFVFALLAPRHTQAITIAEVSGPSDVIQAITANEALAVSFTLSAPFSDVSVSAPIECLGGCSGSMFLMSMIGPGTSVADVIDVVAFDDMSVSPFFTGENLPAGDYFVVLAIDSGTAFWTGTTTPTFFEALGITIQFDFSASPTDLFAPASSFGLILNQGALQFSLESVIQPPPPGNGVPEPATAALGLLSAACLLIGRQPRLRHAVDASSRV